jgi:hypothetical protein
MPEYVFRGVSFEQIQAIKAAWNTIFMIFQAAIIVNADRLCLLPPRRPYQEKRQCGKTHYAKQVISGFAQGS